MSKNIEMSKNGSAVSFDPKTLTLRKQLSVTNNGAWNGEQVTMTVEIDFDGVPVEQVYAWAGQTLVINLQQALRKCDLAFVKQLAKSVYRRKATAMGILDDPSRAYKKALDAINAGDLSPQQVENMLTALQAQLAKLGKLDNRK